jgi:iron complex outermembrane recepter protein
MSRKLMIPLLLAGSAPALAQQATSNVVTQSDDAFGRQVGTERIGIYSNEEVRGFNPIEAGNNRLEGLFIEQGNITSPRLIESSSIRVGYAARSATFPAPTGIVDLKMEKFTGTERYSFEIEHETNPSSAGALEAKVPLAGEKLGLALGVGFREADQIHGRNGSFLNYAAGISWLPKPGSEFILFTSGARARSAEFSASIFPSGSFVPPRQPRRLQQTQPWAQNRFTVSTSGGIAKFPLGDFRIEAGLFRTSRRDKDSFITLLLGTDQSGAVRDHVVIADKGNFTAATSGEFRLSRTWSGKNIRHSLIAAVRGRVQDRAFGGQQNISLGASQAGIQDFRPRPTLNFGPDDTSQVRQFIFGLQYGLLTKSGSSLNLALQKADYRKSTNLANPALTDPVVSDAPWLYSANGALAVSPRLTVYAGLVRGQEDSAVAPDIAVNRSEAPPALLTKQMDAGVRFAITPKLTLIGGVFSIKKPFFGVDSGLRFGNLGTISNRGVELSIAGALAKGLTLVAGGILVNPTIKGPEVDAGRLGKRPTGSFKKRAIFNLDWRPGGDSAWSVDLALDGTSAETGNRLNTFETGGRSNLNLGGRYRFSIGEHKILLRGQVLNALNSYGWRVNSGGGFAFTLPRSVFVQMFADF